MSVRDELTAFNEAYLIERRERREPSALGRGGRPAPGTDMDTVTGAVCLAGAIRGLGHLAARLDPLGSSPPGDPALEPATYGIEEASLTSFPPSVVGGPVADRTGNAREGIDELRSLYSSTRACEFAHVNEPEERTWLRDAVERRRFSLSRDTDAVTILEELTRVEVFERFLHRSFPGKFRFSIEGLDMLVPMLRELIRRAVEGGLRTVLLGMSHRGRLNVMAHVLDKPYARILAEFRDPFLARKFHDELGWTGDVIYHRGESKAIRDGAPVVVTMPPNPSHVEAIDPVVEGMARAAGTVADRGGVARFDPNVTLPVLVHGDAAFPGQGVVAETLNLSRLAGYRTGGTVHFIANNQLGFTTTREDAYSTLYSSDLAKGFEIPIVHVNADDPEACIEVARLALAYRTRFRKDFLVDLVGYRRHGHNESDEPRFTQPSMYRRIDVHPTVRELWARTLGERSQIGDEDAEKMVSERRKVLQTVLDGLDPQEDWRRNEAEPPPPGAARSADTAVSLDRLVRLNETLREVPKGFRMHDKLARAREKRKTILDEPDERTIDWAAAEELAFASILDDGVPIRLTGEDTERGTFSHRHAVLHDAESGEEHVPLQHLPEGRAAFEIHDSPLTENATLGFELGYSVHAPERLTIWEAQYGDFVNGAQVTVDEFLVSARAKWALTPSLVLLLPHGYEGHGPDHSSARLERFLELVADDNLRVTNCTTAAQYFHLVRLQAGLLESDPLPLVAMTPKSLLRHPLAASTPRELSEGGWQRVIDDPSVSRGERDRESVRRMVLCSGKIFVDLWSADERNGHEDLAVCRLEQLAPFPAREVETLLDRYPGLEELSWLQEEPRNMGAWHFVRPRIEALADGRLRLRYVGRARASSPAEGLHGWHVETQKALVRQALEPDSGTGNDDGASESADVARLENALVSGSGEE